MTLGEGVLLRSDPAVFDDPVLNQVAQVEQLLQLRVRQVSIHVIDLSQLVLELLDCLESSRGVGTDLSLD